MSGTFSPEPIANMYVVTCIQLSWTCCSNVYLSMQHQGFFRQRSTGTKAILSTAEKKLILVFAYYIVFAILTLVYYSVVTRDLDNFMAAVKEYFLCEVGGYNPENPCPKSYEQYKYPQLQSTVYSVMGFIPAVNLVFVIDTKQVKESVSSLLQKSSVASSSKSTLRISSFKGERYSDSPLQSPMKDTMLSHLA